MNLSLKWLNDFIYLTDAMLDDLQKSITMKICEVEKITHFLPGLDKILVAYVEEVNPHPNADKLQVCKVTYGEGETQIITGANNVKAGFKYPFIRSGSILPNGTHIKTSSLRGMESNGMLCSAAEIGMENFIFPWDTEGDLLTLPNKVKTGMSLQDWLKVQDTIIEIDNKSITHRPDLWSHFGFARELSAILGQSLIYDPLSDDEPIQFAESSQVSIKSDSAVCYAHARIENISVGISSLDMQAKLIAVGMRPLNILVDISNYVMFDIGQPSHTFDLATINPNKITITLSRGKEIFKALNQKNYTLSDGLPIIQSEDDIIAIGGMIGGMGTQVTPNTQSIFLESANFHRKHIRKAVSTLQLRTDASQRFEKGQDPALVPIGIQRFMVFLRQVCPEAVLKEVGYTQTSKPQQTTIQVDIKFIRDLLGLPELKESVVASILESLYFQHTIQDGLFNIQIPSFRAQFDVSLSVDIVEEIGRIIGYDTIQPRPFSIICTAPMYKNKQRTLEHVLRNLFSNTYNFTEVYNYCFHSNKQIELDKRYSSEALTLCNPIQQESNYMRISPVIGLLENVFANQKNSDNMYFYEIERIFIKDVANQIQEKHFCAGVLVSQEDSDNMILDYLSAMLYDLLMRNGLAHTDQVWSMYSEMIFHPGRCGAVYDENTDRLMVKWGQIHPLLLKKMQIRPKVFYFETFLDNLLSIDQYQTTYKPLPKYPPAIFECTILANTFDLWQDIIEGLQDRSVNNPNQDTTYIDVLAHINTYDGEPIPTGKKAISLRVYWRNNSRTIQNEELKTLQDKLIQHLEKQGHPLKT